MDIRTYLCNLLRCADANCESALTACLALNDELEQVNGRLNEENEQLKLLVPHPAPPKITNIAQKDSFWVNQILSPLGVERLPLDITYYLCPQSEFLNIVSWSWVDTYEYRAEKFDCENFAFLFKAYIDLYFNLNMVGLVLSYKAGHAFNLALFPDGKVMVIEPQNDAVYIYPQMPMPFYDLQDAIVLI